MNCLHSALVRTLVDINIRFINAKLLRAYVQDFAVSVSLIYGILCLVSLIMTHFTARRHASAVYAVDVSVCLSVCHKSVFHWDYGSSKLSGPQMAVAHRCQKWAG